MRYSAKLLGLVGATAIMLPVIQIPKFFAEPWNLVPAALAQDQTLEAEAARLLQQGFEQFNVNQFDAALESWQQALELYQNLENAGGQGLVYWGIGRVSFQKGQYSEALEHYQQALSLFRDPAVQAAYPENSRSFEGAVLNNIGEAYTSLADRTAALTHYQQALAIYQSLEDQPNAAANLSKIGELYSALEQYPQALEAYQQAVMLYQEIENYAEVGLTFYRIGELYRTQEQYTQAVEAHQQAEKAYQQADSPYGQANSLYWMGYAYQSLENYPQALEVYQQALTIYQALEKPADIAYTSENIGDIYAAQGQDRQAQEAYQQALEVSYEALEQYRASADLEGEAQILRNIGYLFIDQGKFAEAQSTFQQGIVIVRQIPDRFRELLALMGLGHSYSSQADYLLFMEGIYADRIPVYQKSLEAFRQAQLISFEIGGIEQEKDAIYMIISAHMNIAWAYGYQQNYPEAITSWQQALDALQSYQDRLLEASFIDDQMTILGQTILGQMGIAYFNNAQYAESIQSHQATLKIAEQLGDFAGQVEQLTSISDRYNRLNQYDQSLAASQQALEILQDQLPQNHDEFIGVLIRLAQTYTDLGQYEQALAYYQQALAIDQDLGKKDNESTIMSNIGGIYASQGQYLQALEPLQSALEINQSAIQRLHTEGLAAVEPLCGESYTSSGIFNQQTCLEKFQVRALSTLNNLGLAYHGLGRYEEALIAYQQVLDYRIKKQDRYGEATVLGNLGTVYSSIGEYSKAIELHQQALQIARAINSRSHEAYALNNLGLAYAEQGQYAQALELYQQGLLIAQSIGDASIKAGILAHIGGIYHAQGKLAEALAQYQASLEIRQRSGEATTINNIAYVYWDQGQLGEALKYLQQSLEIARAAGDRPSEAIILSNIAGLYAEQADYAKALELQQQASSLQQELGGSSNQWSALAGLGQLYFRLGQYDQALDYYQQALQISRQTGEKLSEASSLSFLGGIYLKQEQLDLALGQLQASLSLTQEMGDTVSESRVLAAIGRIYQQQGKPDQAVVVLEQALKTQREVGVRPDEGRTLTVLGLAYGSQGHLTEATATLQQAIIIHQETGNLAAEAEALANLGAVLAETQPELAVVFYKQSVNVREEIRGGLQTLPRDLQQTYTESVAEAYRALADLLLQQDRVLEAQQVLDLLKVQELEDYLHNVRGNAQTASGIVYNQPEQAIIARYQRLQENATALSQERARLVAQRQTGSLTPAEEQRLVELRDLPSQLKGQFNEFIASPDIQNLLNQPITNREVYGQTLQLDSLTRLKEELAEVNGVLLYPLVLDNRLELIITAPNSEPIRRTVEGVNREELNRVITEFRQALDSPTGDIMPSAQKLYSWLIEPIEADLAAAGVDTIIYAPDGPLRYIPLAALHDGNQWLIQRFAINNITAVSLERRATPTVADLSILAGAFANSATVYSPEAARGDQYYGLPFAGEEVKTLQALLPTTTALYDADFSLESLKNGLDGKFNTLHFATHAALVSNDARQSFILFGNGDILTLAAIQDLSFNSIDLVVLSACETGLGGFDNNGEQILGLGYQFQSQGAGAVVASLWQVNDGGTQVLMNAFYSALNQGMGKAEALQAAQQAMITGNLAAVGGDRGASIEVVSTTTGQPLTPGGTLAHPYYWAPFILIGL